MNGEIKTQGIVLLSAPCGEYDRRLVVLTAQRGRITVFARGARRPGNSFSACTQTFTFAVFTLYEGREAYTLKSAEHTRFFEELRDDPVRACYGIYFCEMASNCSREGMDEETLMKLLYLALSALSKNVIDARLVRAVFELRCIADFGEAPLAEGTWYSRAGNGLAENPLGAANGLAEKSIRAGSGFSEKMLGAGSGEEARGEKEWALKGKNDGFEVGKDTVSLTSYIITAPLMDIFTFSVPETTILELLRMSSDWSEYRIGRKLKSKDILEMIEK
ncbi:MAG: DNA repair protein RecO [Lachnospiraceae bacterium]|nr:DNA repair protein RecO [Lachnospiraceae bacterium]